MDNISVAWNRFSQVVVILVFDSWSMHPFCQALTLLIFCVFVTFCFLLVFYFALCSSSVFT
jgi:hypothetical protein